MKKIKLAILDSGVRIDHPAFINKTINGFSLRVDGNSVKRNEEFNDNIGHGTAIFYLIDKFTDNVEITNIKIYDLNLELMQRDLEILLDYIYQNYDYDVINISMGFISCGNVTNLQRICDAFYAKGTIIVSAFDNNGAVSFPAALNNVVGVDGQENIKDYVYVENSIINIIGRLENVRVAWLKPDYIIVKGNSFLCAKISAMAAQILQDLGTFDLRKICIDKYQFQVPADNHIPFSINKASIFPFNKEIHAIARFERLLNFDIIDYYSVRITGYVGRKISDILSDCDNSKIIKDINAIDWDKFDTLILGHTGELSRLTKSDYNSILVNKALEKGKKVYSFDDITTVIDDRRNLQNSKIYFPKIDSTNIKKRLGKLYKTSKPILAVIGTNSRQGKFSLQLMLREKFMKLGYKVGQIGTEPSAPLFGLDEVFHCGYNGQINLDISQTYIAVNDMIWNITQKDVDLIIAGTQSGFLAYNDYNAMMFPTYHQIFFTALQPDAIIVCINPYDDVEFVNRIIKAAEGLSGGKVVGIVCFPIDISEGWKGNFGKKIRISEEKELNIKSKFSLYRDVQVCMLDKQKDLEKLVSICIDYFQ